MTNDNKPIRETTRLAIEDKKNFSGIDDPEFQEALAEELRRELFYPDGRPRL